jgi:hypothetical protein
MNLQRLKGSGVVDREVHVRTATRTAIGDDLSGRLGQLGIRLVPDDTRPGAQEKRELQDALGVIRDHLRDHPPLTGGHVAERDLFRVSIGDIRPHIGTAVESAGLMVLAALPEPVLPMPVATEVRVTPEFRDSFMALDPESVANLAACAVTLVVDAAAATPRPLEAIRDALLGVRGSIGSEADRATFNANVATVNALIAADDVTGMAAVSTRYRIDVTGDAVVLPGLAAAGFPDIAHHAAGYLRDRFDAATRKFMMIKWQIESHPGCPPGIKKDLQVCALDFLVHGAMVTMTTGREVMDMPLLEFRGEGVNVDSAYHRAQGKGAVTQLFKELLQESGDDYRFLFKTKSDARSIEYNLGAGNRRDACVLVDGPDIMRTLDNKYAPVRPAIAGDAALMAAVTAAVGLPAGQMLDVSAYFVGSAGRDELARRMDVVRAAIHANAGMIGIPIVAQFPVSGVTVAVAFDTRADNPHQRELNTLATFGGGRTDIIALREAVVGLVDTHAVVGLEALRGKLPVTTAAVVVRADGLAPEAGFTPARITDAVSTVCAALDDYVADPVVAAGLSPRATLYYGLVSQTLHFLEDKLPTADMTDFRLNRYVYDTIGRIGDLVVGLAENEALAAAPVFTNKVDLLMEDVFHVMALLRVPTTDIPTLLNPVGAGLPPASLAAKRSYIFNSGMKATTCITNALHRMQAGGHRPGVLPGAVPARLTVGYASDIYFESRSLIAGGHAEQSFDVAVSVPLDAAGGAIDRDVFFFDFLPNAAAVLGDVSEHPGVAVVTRAISGRTPANPVTVVIDTTTDIFDGARTAAVLADPAIATAIGDGTLNLVVVDSLAKFAQAGRDKYTGGVIQTYNDGSPYFNDFNVALNTMQAMPEHALSAPANRFFAAMLDPTYAKSSFEGQLAAVRASTNALSAALRTAGALPLIHVDPGAEPVALSGRPCIELTSRERHGVSDIPMLGLKFNRLMADPGPGPGQGGWTANGGVRNRTFGLIHHYLLALCQARDLPLSTRGSFGFDHATLTEALPPETMRLTVGLEDDSQIAAYATILRQASAEIQAHFDITTAVTGERARFNDYAANSVGIAAKLENPERRTAIMEAAAAHRATHGVDMPFADFVAFCGALPPPP